MSHYVVFVFGKEPVGDQLEPYWELDMTQEDMKKDPRAEFVAAETAESALEKFIIHNETYEEQYSSVQEYMQKWHGYIQEGDEYGYYHNPNAKWDWWVVGGRWGFFLMLKDKSSANTATVGEVDWPLMEEELFSPYAVLIDGKWTAKGEMGWFGLSDDHCEDNKWDEWFWTKVKELPDDYPVTVVDLHI
jgi:hypothetical protein